jgi:hypothetical protein
MALLMRRIDNDKGGGFQQTRIGHAHEAEQVEPMSGYRVGYMPRNLSAQSIIRRPRKSREGTT